MKKKWDDVVASAGPLINFLHRDAYFNKPYNGNATALVLTDARAAVRYASDDSLVDHDDWETITDSLEVFPPNFEWSSWIDHNLAKNNFFDIVTKDFSAADFKWTQGNVCLLHELMQRDIRILLNCYSNDIFPDIWQSILDTYLHDGFPCGWDGMYPSGRLVIFTNA